MFTIPPDIYTTDPINVLISRRILPIALTVKPVTSSNSDTTGKIVATLLDPEKENNVISLASTT